VDDDDDDDDIVRTATYDVHLELILAGKWKRCSSLSVYTAMSHEYILIAIDCIINV
jgi:hypothetical protein